MKSPAEDQAEFQEVSDPEKSQRAQPSSLPKMEDELPAAEVQPGEPSQAVAVPLDQPLPATQVTSDNKVPVMTNARSVKCLPYFNLSA